MASLCILVLCGVTSALAGVSGVETMEKQELQGQGHGRPYMAYLVVGKEKISSNCGGFLIREDFILTAAHCQGKHYLAVLGANNIMVDEAAQQLRRVAKAIPHPDYKEYENDIMLLKLKRRVLLNENVSVIPLPWEEKIVSPSTVCSVAGWGGGDQDTRYLSDTLREVNVTVWSDTFCKEQWEDEYNDRNICAGDPDHDVCRGDGGGPLVCDGVVYGIVSKASSRCGLKPSIYTKISKFFLWINETLANN
ncbi:granzyme B(G,H) [Amia ocellicauda]|uniref:granzyme B(G,H) n=1 Tax=Amia ocellicauda TaxID=2972642 RepID=UPI003463A2C2|nr:GRAB protein [Amia calva]